MDQIIIDPNVTAADIKAAETTAAPEIKAEAGSAPVDAAPAERPSWLPAGFDTPEAFAEAYAKGQAKLAELTKSGDEKPDDGEDDPLKIKAPDPAEFDFAAAQAKYHEEFVKTGALSEETRTEIYKRYEGFGIPRAEIDAYLNQQMEAQRH